MKGVKKCFGLLLVLFIIFGCSLVVYSGDANAASASANYAYVNFWSSSSQQGQVATTVQLPWTADVGGTSSNRQQFYINDITMTYPISAQSSASYIYGRLVMRFTPIFTANENAYFCDKNLNQYQSSVVGEVALCSAFVTYNYSDNTTYTVSAPLYFNYLLPSGDLAAYVDYSQALPSYNLSSITFKISKAGSNDVYSTTNGYGAVLTTLVSDASYYITDSGSGTDISPIINQNNTIINQQQQTYDWLTDNSAPSADTSALGQSAGWLPAGPVDSILTLPVTLAQGIVGVFTGTHTCTPIVLPFSLGPYNESLTIPCMDEYFRIAQISILWNAVGSIIAAFIVYDTLKWLYKFVDDTLTLRENNSGLWGGL